MFGSRRAVALPKIISEKMESFSKKTILLENGISQFSFSEKISEKWYRSLAALNLQQLPVESEICICAEWHRVNHSPASQHSFHQWDTGCRRRREKTFKTMDDFPSIFSAGRCKDTGQ
jgi:hypothetical protein